jgi:hypothetical protein
MFTDFLGGFLGALGGLAAGVAVLRYLLGRYIELQISKDLAVHKYGLDKQLTTLQAQLSRFSDVLSRRNEREFAVTEGTWERLIKAVGTAQNELGNGKPVPAFVMMSEEEGLAIIEKLSFSDEQKAALRAERGQARDDLYRQFDFRRGVYRSLDEWSELKNWVSTHQIFLHDSVLAPVIKLRDDLHGLLVHAELYAEGDEKVPLAERIEMHEKLAKDFNKAIDDLALAIRTRFGFTNTVEPEGKAVATNG